MKKGCIQCEEYLQREVYNYSITNFGAPLCLKHQDWFKNLDATKSAVKLYFALKKRGVPAQIEKFDGYKTIDIAIPECKVNIEVDGIQHNTNSGQALADLERTYYSFLKGYFTLRIPNSLIRENLDESVDYIVRMLKASNKRKWESVW